MNDWTPTYEDLVEALHAALTGGHVDPRIARFCRAFSTQDWTTYNAEDDEA
jgi:hypothetical protein